MDVEGLSLVEVQTHAQQTGSNPFASLSGLPLVQLVLATPRVSDRRGLLQRLEGARRVQAMLACVEADLLLALAGEETATSLHEVEGRVVPVVDEVVTEIALQTKQTEAAVRNQLQTARTLQAGLPGVKAAWADGRIDSAHAAVIARSAERIPESARMDMQDLLLDAAATMHVKDLKLAAEHAVRKVDPDGAEARRARAARRRDVWTSPDVDGNTLLHARLASMDAYACLRLITDAARKRKEQSDREHSRLGMEAPSIGMLRAEEFVSRLFHAGASLNSTVPGEGEQWAPHTGMHVEVQVQVDLATLAGLADNPVRVDGLALADINGLRAFIAKADDVNFRRLLTESSSGRLLEFGHRSYRAPVALRKFIEARDGKCIVEGCHQPAVECDLDHAVPWDAGGNTAASNLNALCRRHHLLKTHAGYRLVQDERGKWLYVTPTGEMAPVEATEDFGDDVHPPDS